MEIAGVLAGLSGLRGITGLISQRFQTHDEQSSAVAGDSSADLAAVSAGENLPDFDLHKTTPRELSRLAHQLFASGAITVDEFQDLADIRAELDVAARSPDEPIDVLEILTSKLERLQASAQRQDNALLKNDFQVRQTHRQLDLLTRLDSLTSGSSTGRGQTLDATA